MKNLIISLIGISVILFYACGDTFSTVVEIDPPEFEKKLTITSFINTEDTVVGFFVGQNRGILDPGNFEDYELDDAIITITDELSGETLTAVPNTSFNNFSFSYNYIIENISPQYFSSGNTYSFNVEHKDFISSSTVLDFPLKRDILENIVYKRNDGIDIEGDESSSVSFDIIDDKDSEDYYEVELSSIGGPNSFFTFWIESIDPSAIKGFPDDILFISDESFNGERKNIKVKFDRYNYDGGINDILQVSWRSISKDAYNYSITAKRYDDTDGTPFLSPVQLHSNVNNALGAISLKSEVIYLVE